MTEHPPHSPGVDLLDVHRLRCAEAAPPALSPGEREAMEREWEEAVRANPSLFDGPTVLCTRLHWEEPGSLVLSWARAPYRYRALRRIPGARPVSSVSVCLVQPTDDGRLVVGRMASWTAAPGRWQLPGGSMEPPPGGAALDLAALRRHAARELVEETGVETPPEELTFWLVSRGEHGNVGFFFRAPARPARLLHERFAARAAAERARGVEPELDRIALVASAGDLAGLDGSHVDYLHPVVHRYAGTHRAG
ncbi:NUDIX hydrolase [Streptomyces sp. JJ36]|uniref:NUDIX hydrolase n=1 Tax=Streptomyces sp. JJ36 TaxID=2736645 RepID=UPI001F26C596|nr:NUDIX hydrolase [Streptomyces sp. JJ36]